MKIMKRPVAATVMATIALTGAGMLTTSSAFAAENEYGFETQDMGFVPDNQYNYPETQVHMGDTFTVKPLVNKSTYKPYFDSIEGPDFLKLNHETGEVTISPSPLGQTGHYKFMVAYSKGVGEEPENWARGHINVLPPVEKDKSESEKAPDTPAPDVTPTPTPEAPNPSEPAPEAPKPDTPAPEVKPEPQLTPTPEAPKPDAKPNPTPEKPKDNKDTTVPEAPKVTEDKKGGTSKVNEAKANELAKTGVTALGGLFTALGLTGTGAGLVAWRRKH
ncbi:Uncharacterised protein [Arcanobacterium haemolyticum]|uniref:hypothetical protein n=1 Tax=Arcanobacterium haemolyticum TaxID=28264 RepID=UPI000D8952BA|nr:hypothetical protein [Arcanobacterium haemolyticum]SPT74824.1 Uncharacterised protein [Arcanobacterium haemolyticum]